MWQSVEQLHQSESDSVDGSTGDSVDGVTGDAGGSEDEDEVEDEEDEEAVLGFFLVVLDLFLFLPAYLQSVSLSLGPYLVFDLTPFE